MTRWPGSWPGAWPGDWQGGQEASPFANMAMAVTASATVTASLEAVGGSGGFADMAMLGQGAGSLVGSLFGPAPVQPYFGGGYNADREWLEREEAERQSAEHAEKAQEAAQKAQDDKGQAKPPRATDSLLRLVPQAPAPIRPRIAPRVAFALLAERLRAFAVEQERAAAEEAERQAIAFAIEQQRLAEEAAARQLALDDEAAQALLALLMQD